ncbi:MAG: prepilin-type N-terminal cleavage/methylation domain-containing protein [Bdellovibrionales bacterium]|nr:prepilin-type N-terminal cleavage/methylation domain-containing protein [Bdellovibrionales bacterium]
MLSKKGFTLLELIVVTAIISILFSISYASYQGYHRRSRAYSAKQNLSSIVAMAEVFKANTGFYLPNLRAMHIPIKGRYSYNYKVICHTDGTSANAHFETNAANKICGDFDIQTTSTNELDTSSGTSSCLQSDTKCWMGAVLCNHYNNGTAIACGSEDYTIRSEDRGVMQWKSPTDDWTVGTPKNEFILLFNIIDFAGNKKGATPGLLNGGEHCKRVSRSDDVFADPSDCFFNKEFAVHSNDIRAIIYANWTGNEESFISTPSKLAVTALACKDRQNNCTGTSPPGGLSIIRMDTNRLVEIVQ